MRYAAVRHFDITNGEGVGISLFVQGCNFHCYQCFNPETWDFNLGKEWTEDVEEKFLSLAGRDYIKRISILGGSPLCQENAYDISQLVTKLKHKYPDKQIWVFTGYTWENLISPVIVDELSFTIWKESIDIVLHNIDVLVDGQFIYDKRDLSLAFRGSSNQRIIDVKETLKRGEVVLWE